jgi:hypothetical protein
MKLLLTGLESVKVEQYSTERRDVLSLEEKCAAGTKNTF